MFLHQSLGITFCAILRKYTENSGSRSVTPCSFLQINDRIHPQVDLSQGKENSRFYTAGSSAVPLSFPIIVDPGNPSRYYCP